MADKQTSGKKPRAADTSVRNRERKLPAPIDITPVAEKIGEDKDNLKARAAAFKRRRGGA